LRIAVIVLVIIGTGDGKLLSSSVSQVHQVAHSAQQVPSPALPCGFHGPIQETTMQCDAMGLLHNAAMSLKKRDPSTASALLGGPITSDADA
jgi:hypothetical protein